MTDAICGVDMAGVTGTAAIPPPAGHLAGQLPGQLGGSAGGSRGFPPVSTSPRE